MIENLYAGSCIRTYSGQYVDVFNPDPDTILIEDIAHALSHVSRWNGHTMRPLSVAQHSVDVAAMLPEHLRLCGLLHDASEAYLPDMPGPIKAGIPGFKLIEDKLMQVIAKKFGFLWPMPLDVKEADKVVLEEEWLAVLDGYPFHFWTADFARCTFLEYYARIKKPDLGDTEIRRT